MRLRMERSVRETVLDHAREGAPEEVCGVLGGTPGGPATHPDDPDDRSSVARTVERVPNVADTPRTRYELDPGEQFRGMEAIEAYGGEVVGFYHSHLRGDVPAECDRRGARDLARLLVRHRLSRRAGDSGPVSSVDRAG